MDGTRVVSEDFDNYLKIVIMEEKRTCVILYFLGLLLLLRS